MGAGRRWLVAVLAGLAGFGGCWLGMASARVLDTGTQVGVASVPLVVILTVLGAWAEQAREKVRPGSARNGQVSARVEGSPQGQAIGQAGDGSVVIGPGASLPNAVFNLSGEKDPGRERLRASGLAGVLVVGDVPQEPAAFQPRAALMAALEREAGPRVSVVSAVTGIRGVGKTQVAAAYARRRIADGWRLVAWVNAGDTGSVLAGLSKVARAANLDAAGQDAHAAAMAVRHWLEGDGERRLVVFDNAADLDGLRPFLPAGGAGQVVITSTRRSAVGLGAAVLVDVFTLDEAVAYLGKRTGLGDVAGGRVVARELGCLPLGLAQAAAVITREHLDYRTYLGRLRSVPLARYLGRVEGDAYPYKTAEAIVLSLRDVEDGDPAGRCGAVMGLMAMLSEAGVSRWLLHAVASRVFDDPAEDEASVMDEVAGRLADASLVSFSLDGSVLAAHRLVMRVVRERLVADGQLVVAAGTAIVALSRTVLVVERIWEDRPGLREMARREMARQVLALHEHAGRYLDAPAADVLLRLRGYAVDWLNGLGDSTGQALVAAVEVANDRERVLGADHPDTLTSYADIAIAVKSEGKLDLAIPMFEHILAASRRVLGEDHPDTLRSRNNLAGTYKSAGRLDEAIPLHEQVLADCERILGADHLSTLVSRSNLALAYRSAGRLDEAISLLEQTLAGRQRVLGDDHPDTLASRNNLACAYESAGRLDEAISLHEQTLADQQRILGDNHPDTLASRNDLALAYRSAGRLDEAIPLLEQTLAASRRVLGDNHPDTLCSRNNLAHAYEVAGRLDEAIPLQEQALADCKRVLGGSHLNTLISRSNLALAYRSAGRLDEAIPLLEQTLADRQRILGDDHPGTLASRNNLACAYESAGRLDEAISLHEQTVADQRRVLGDNHPQTLASRSNLAGAYESAARLDEAIPLLEQTLADYERILGANHPATVTARRNLGAVRSLASDEGA